jgi:hypothetical protein
LLPPVAEAAGSIYPQPADKTVGFFVTFADYFENQPKNAGK